MHLVRYAEAEGPPAVGMLRGGTVRQLAGVATMSALLRMRLDELRDMLERSASGGAVGVAAEVVSPQLLAPLDGRGEVWCAGVTYARSRGARMEESAEQSVYDKVYVADRPELFGKASAWRVVTDGEPIGIRADSGHDVPEPELAVVVNAHGETVGYTICNDVSSRSIEGANPLYIPQAKVFAGGCALAPGIRPAWEVPDPADLEITLSVRRDGTQVFEGSTSTGQLARPLDDLVDALCEANDFPDGVVLATGTGIVPALDFALREGDVVEIVVDQVGRLRNSVAVGKQPFGWLADRTTRPELEEIR